MASPQGRHVDHGAHNIVVAKNRVLGVDKFTAVLTGKGQPGQAGPLLVQKLGFQEQSPDFLRLAEFYSTCFGRW